MTVEEILTDLPKVAQMDDSQLAHVVNALGLFLPGASDADRRQAVRVELGRRWREENAEAIAAYNERIEREGTILPSLWGVGTGRADGAG